jgi:hypothetical protein
MRLAWIRIHVLTRRANPTLGIMRSMVPSIPPPMYMTFSICVQFYDRGMSNLANLRKVPGIRNSMTVVCDNHRLAAHIGRLAGFTRFPE